MVSIFTGLGAGFERGSAATLKSLGLLGSGSFGRNGEQISVNAATGNLLITQRDEFLVGRGPDSAIGRTYNSFEDVADGDNNDHWRQSTTRGVHGLTGTLNTAGSTIKRDSGDGSVITYSWNATASAYIATDGAGAYDKLTYASGVWTWTDGDTQLTEKYAAHGVYGLTGTVNSSGSTITRIKSDGTSSTYSWDTATSKYIASAGTASTDNLTYAGGVWTWSNNGSPLTQYYYANGANWRVTEVSDTVGQKLTFSYLGAALDKVTTQDGSYEQYSWSSGRITQIVTGYTDLATNTARTLTRTRYGYDGSNRLATVTVDLSPGDNAIGDGKTYVTTYGYDTSGRVSSITETDGSSVAITYDSSNRVETVTQAVAGTATRTTTFSYDTVARQTTVRDALNQKTVLKYDANGNLTQIVTPPANGASAPRVQQFAYNANGDVISVDQGDGNIIVYGYDADGNRTSQRDALGNTVSWAYQNNQLLTETRYLVPDPDGAGPGVAGTPQTIRYVYNADLTLRYAISAEGAVTAYGYDAYGNRTSAIEYLDGKYPVSGLQPTDIPTATQISNWIAGRDKSAGRRTETVYDARGNVAVVRGYSRLLSTGEFDTASEKSETVYAYNQAGELLVRRTFAGNASKVDSFAYDGLGRTISTSNSNGLQTTIAFADATQTTTVTLASGLTQVSVYNLAGELISYTQAASGVATAVSSYKYDALGQVKLATDPLGNRTYYFYDAVGRKTAQIDALGAITEYRYDAQNNVTSTTQYATRLTPAQLGTLVDGSGNPTAVSLASLRPTANADDRWTFNIYDLSGRLVQTIDATGATTVYAYDGASRLISSTQYATRMSAAQIATLKAAETNQFLNPNDGTLWSYDAGMTVTAAGTIDGANAFKFTVGSSGQARIFNAYLPVVSAGQTVTLVITLMASGTTTGGVLDLWGAQTAWGNASDATATILSGPGTLTPGIGASTTVSGLSTTAATRIAITHTFSTADTQLLPIFWIKAITASAGDAIIAAAPVVTTRFHTASYIPTADAANDRTSRIFYDADGNVTGTLDAEGYLTQSIYDTGGTRIQTLAYANAVAGNLRATGSLAQLLDSAGTPTAATTTYKYDALGRLRLTTDGLNNRTHYFYDAAGRKTAEVDSLGALTEYRYDGEGSVTSTTQYATRLTPTQFGTLIDGNGNPTAVTLASLRPTASGDDRWTFNIYDLSERLVQTVDGTGATTIYAYDGASQLVSTTQYATRMSAAQIATLKAAETNQWLNPDNGSLWSYDAGVTVTAAGTIDGANAYRFTTSATGQARFFNAYLPMVSPGQIVTFVVTLMGSGTTTGGVLEIWGTQTAWGNASDGSAVILSGPGTLTPLSGTGMTISGLSTTTGTRIAITRTFSASDNQVLPIFWIKAVNSAPGDAIIAAAPVVTTRFRAPSYVPAVDAANDRTSRIFYDAEGNVTGTLNAEGYLTQSIYDASGTKIQTIAYANATGTAGNIRATGSLADLLASVTPDTARDVRQWMLYDARGFLAATIDGEGNLTRFRYTAAGYVDQQIKGQKLDPAALIATPPTLAGLPAAPAGATLETIGWTRNAFGQALTETRSLTGSVTITTTYRYNAVGKLVSTVTQSGGTDPRTYSQRYDALGRLTSELSGIGNTVLAALSNPNQAQIDQVYVDYGWTYSYDKAGRLAAKRGPKGTEASGARTLYYYTAEGDLAYEIDALGAVVEHRYNSFGQRSDMIAYAAKLAPAAINDWTGGEITSAVRSAITGLSSAALDTATHFDFNVDGTVKQSIDANGNVSSFTYNAFGNLIGSTVPRDGAAIIVSTRSYDRLGLLKTEVVDAAVGGKAITTSYGYDAFGRAVQLTNANGKVTRSAYDRDGRLVSVTDALNNITYYAYDARDNLVAVTDANGKITRYVYDKAGRRIATIDALGGVVANSYDADGRLVATREYLNTVNPALLPLEVTEAALALPAIKTGDRVTRYAYDKDGQLRFEIDGLGHVTEYAYNAQGKVIRTVAYDGVIGADGTGLYAATWIAGQVASFASAPGTRVSRAVYDAVGRLTYSIDALGQVTVSTYDAKGQLTKQVQVATFYTATGDPSLAAMDAWLPSSANDRTTRSLYDRKGQLSYSVDALGYVTRYEYDKLGKVLRQSRYESVQSVGDATTVDTISIVSPTNVRITQFSYDSAGRLETTTDPANIATRLTLDQMGQITSSTEAFGTTDARTTTYAYDAVGHVIDTTDALRNIVHKNYDALGRVVAIVRIPNLTGLAALPGAGIDEKYYLATYADIGPSGLTPSYHYDLAGWRERRNPNAMFNTAYYLDQNPDIAAAGINPFEHFIQYGWREGRRPSANYSASDYLAQYANVTETFSYDAAGRVEQHVVAAGTSDQATTRYSYDALDRVVTETDARNSVTIRTYDALGQLASKAESGTTGDVITFYTYDNFGNVWRVIDPRGNATYSYYDKNGRLTLKIDAENYATGTSYTRFGEVESVTRYSSRIAGTPAAGTPPTLLPLNRIENSQFAGPGNWDRWIASSGLTFNSPLFTGVWNGKNYIRSDFTATAGGQVTSIFTGENSWFEVTAGERLAIQAGVEGLGAVRQLTLHVWWSDVNGNRMSEGSFVGTLSGPQSYDTKISGFVTVPAGAVSARLELYMESSGAGTGSFNIIAPMVTSATATQTTIPAYVPTGIDATTWFNYDKLGRLVRTTDAENNSEVYTLNAYGERVQVRNKLGGITTNVYDKRGLLINETLPLATYDSAGNLAGSAVVNSYDYDRRGNLVRKTEADNFDYRRTTRYSYDALDRLSTTTGDAVATGTAGTMAVPTEYYYYDWRGNLIESRDAAGARTLFRYDSLDRKTGEINALGTLSTFSYDANGNLTASRVFGTPVALPATPNSLWPAAPSTEARLTTYEYDRANRRTATQMLGVRTGYWNGSSYIPSASDTVRNTVTYDANGNVVKSTDANGNEVFSYYDRLNRKIASVDQEGYLTSWTLDAEGNALSETRYAQRPAAATLGVPPAIPNALATDTANRNTTFTYDRNGRRLTETRGAVEASTVGGNGALSSSNAGSVIRYEYNGLGQVTKKTEANLDYTKHEYDYMGRETRTTRTPFTDYRGVENITPTTDIRYNGLNQVLRTIQRGDGTLTAADRETIYTYTAGRLTRMTDPTGFGTNYYYDVAGQLVAQTYSRQKSNGSLETNGNFFSYDAAGRETSRKMGVLNGSVWTFGDTTDEYYNSYGEIIAQGTNTGGVKANAQQFADYDMAGRVWRTNFKDGITKVYAYDKNGNATMLLQSTGTVDLKTKSNIDQVFNNLSGVSLTLSIFDKRNQLIETFQQASNNIGANPIRPELIPDPTGHGVASFYADGDVVEKVNKVEVTNNPAVKPTESPESRTTATGGGVSFDVLIARGWESNGTGDWGSLTILADRAVFYGNGVVHVIITDAQGTRSLGDFTPSNNLTNDATSVRFSSYLFTSGMVSFTLTQDVPGGQVVIAQPSMIIEMPIPGPDFEGPRYATSYEKVYPAPKLHFQNENANATVVQMFVRPTGSGGAYQKLTATQLNNSMGSNIAGWFTYDLTQSPFNGLPANSSWDIKYLAMDAAGKIYDSKQAVLSRNSNGSPVLDNVILVDVRGPGQAMLTNDSGRDWLILSGLPAAPVNMRYRPLGSSGGWSVPVGVNPAGYGQNGLAAVDVTGVGGPVEYWVELADGTKLHGTLTVGGQASLLTQYKDASREIILRPPPGQTVTWQQFRYFRDGAWSSWIPQSGGGNWTYNAKDLADFYSSRSYPIEYETYNVDTLVSRSEATLTFGYDSQSMSTFSGAPGMAAKVLFDPKQNGVAKIVLYWRDRGSTGAFTAVTISKAGGIFAWDVDAAGVRPGTGTRNLEYYYDAYAADNTILPTLNHADHAMGYLAIQSDRYADTTNNALVWRIDTAVASQYLVHRTQSFNAFGEIASETDGNGRITSFNYNTMGRLTGKISPQVDVTDESGVTTRQSPTEYYYYDQSGRLVGKRDANQKFFTQTLLAGSGQGGDTALTIGEFNPDNSQKAYGYDIFGDLRKITDGLGAVTNNTYDKAGRLIQVDHPVRVNGNSPGVRLVDYYSYDGLGQRIKHSNSVYGGTVAETTDYDVQGRVVSTVSFGGLATTYSYTWYSIASNLLGTIGLGNFGGWQTITTNSAGLNSYENRGLFGQINWRQDFGGHSSHYTYDLAGHLVGQTGSTGQSISYTYYNNGYIASITDNTLRMRSTFQYDNEGNRTLETYNSTDASPIIYQNASVSYDELNRVVRFKDAKAEITYKYDANGNRREVKSIYNDGVDGTERTQDYWYKYDSMNRFVLTMGTLLGGNIVAGNAGVALTYDPAGNRKTATTAGSSEVETYTYTADGYLEDTIIAGVVRARRTNDALGRVTSYTQFAPDGAVSFTRTLTYDRNNRVTDQTETDAANGNVITTIHNDYRAYVAGSGYTGLDQGVITHSSLVKSTVTTETVYSYEWWDEAKQLAIRVDPTDRSNPNTGQWASGFSRLSYDENGHLKQVVDTQANRVLSYRNDAYGQVLVREEKINNVLGARQLYYYFDGRRIGDVGNSGPSPSLIDYAQELALDRNAPRDKGGFRNGRPVESADFDQNFQPINASYPGPVAAMYTARNGDTLQSIARAAWGDANLWYLIADANGLTGNATLVAGQTLSIPNKVTNFHNTSETFRVYNPGEAIGDAMPTLPAAPTMPAPPPPKKNGCGILGAILLAAVAVAVTLVIKVPVSKFFGTLFSAAGASTATAATAGSIVGATATGAIASAVSQGVGIATGIQDKFSWKAVALAGISAGIGEGLGQVGFLKDASGIGKNIQDVARGALGNAATQGIAVATRLQTRFDWSGVAVGAVVSGVNGATNFGGFEGRLVSGVLGAIAGGATRSLIDGSSFGDNVIAALPDVIGATIGQIVADGVQRTVDFGKQVSALEKAGISTKDAKSYVRQLGKLQRGDISGFLDQGGAGGAGITAHTPAEERAYAAALSQTGSASDAQTALLATALSERLDLDARRVGASSLSTKVKDGFFRFKGAIDRALISTEVYFDRTIPEMLPKGYSRLSGAQVRSLGFDPSRLTDTASGYFSALYVAPGENYIYANRGTDSGADWKSNALQSLGKVSPQYQRAIDNAVDLRDTLQSKLSFTGHSLGGGLATAQALVTGLRATVFDPAGVHSNTLARYNANFSRVNELVTSYYVQGEFLHGLNDQLGTPTRGRVVGLPAVEQLSRDQSNFLSTPTSDLAGFDGTARHATSALLSSMFYKYATMRTWP
ncbi:MAG: LysM peptidoglycan-binding domain-containing protein [Candidatus Sphingomonas phytovorans]|nr:LysM peptidoglycan-binding domain-containing protein [Sphingomonas sp.]WEJ99469.1 MAG: LysM peptidoglycan-binding domain-containing protein [Sphingomonas sp.]